MGNLISADTVEMPFELQRVMRGFGIPFRNEVRRFIMKRIKALDGKPFGWEDYCHCVCQASITLFDKRPARMSDNPDFASMQRAIADFDEGRSRPLKDYVDELRRRAAA